MPTLAEIQSLQESLERRSRQVEIASQVAQELTALPALEDLYERVVTLIKERFEYYHAQIFRYEPVVDACVLVTSYGQAGKALLAERHRLPMGRGVVGAAAATGRPVIASDATEDPDWVPNPHLPETKGELAVPIKLRDQVLGILDVQSDRAGALGHEDQVLLEGLCGQIAAAIESTRLRQEMESSIHELQDLYRVLRRERWETLDLDVDLRGYLYDQKEILRADDLWAPEIALAVERRAIVPPADSEGRTPGDLADGGMVAAAPLSLLGEAVGALGVQQDPENPLSPEELALVGAVAEQVAQALESAQLFGEEQRARSLLSMRVKELDCLNDIGRKIDEAPPIPELLEWVASRVPDAMQHPNLCVVAIELEGQVYGAAEALSLPRQIVQGLYIQGEQVGRVCIAYDLFGEDAPEAGAPDAGGPGAAGSRAFDFLDEESALLGDLARRVNGYIENRRLFEETQQAARNLQEERLLLRTVIDTLPDVIYIKDKDSRFLLNNLAHLRDHLKVESQEEVLGKTDFDMFPYELAAPFYADEQEIIRTGQPLLDREEYILDESGTKTWLWTTKVPAYDSEGQITAIVGIGRDISERKEATLALERRRAQLQCLSDIGQRISESPPIPEMLAWATERIPAAMQYPDLCRVAVEYRGKVYGAATAASLPRQIVQGLHIRGELVGRVCIAYDATAAGDLDVGNGNGLDFLDEESALLGDISRRLAGYVENRWLLEEAQARADELAVLNEMSRALGQTLDLSDVLENVYYYSSRLLDATNFYIALHDAGRDEIVFALDYEEGKSRAGQRRRAGKGLTEYVIHSRQPLLIKDNVEASIADLPGVEHIGAGARSWLGVPLVIGDQVLGVIAAQSYTTAGLYDERHRDLLTAVANHAAIAIQSVRLFEEARARAERERLVRTITDRVRRGADREAIMRITLQELGQMLGASRSAMRLGTPEQLTDS